MIWSIETAWSVEASRWLALGAQAETGDWREALRAWLISATPGALDGWLADAPPALALAVLLLGVGLTLALAVGLIRALPQFARLEALERASSGAGAGRGGRASDAWIEIERARKLSAQNEAVGARISAETAYGVAQTPRERVAATAELAMAIAVGAARAAAEGRAEEERVARAEAALRIEEASTQAAERVAEVDRAEGWEPETLAEMRRDALWDQASVATRLGETQMALRDPAAAAALFDVALSASETAETAETAAEGAPADARARAAATLRLAGATSGLLRRAEAAAALAQDPAPYRRRAAALAERMGLADPERPLPSAAASVAAEALEAAAAHAEESAARAARERALELRSRAVDSSRGDRSMRRLFADALERMADRHPGEGFATRALAAAEAASLGPTVTQRLAAKAALD